MTTTPTELRRATADTALALALAAHDATRFLPPGGAAAELRRASLALAAAASPPPGPVPAAPDPGALRALLDRLDDSLERARRRGAIDLGAAAEILELRARLALELAALEAGPGRGAGADGARAPGPRPAGDRP